jgi:hypothetical protein
MGSQAPHERKIWHALFFEKDGDLNLTWLFVLIMGIIGSAGFVYSLVTPTLTIVDRLVAWAFISGSFMAVLLAAIPLAKAKLLSTSTLPVQFAETVLSGGGIRPVLTDMNAPPSGTLAVTGSVTGSAILPAPIEPQPSVVIDPNTGQLDGSVTQPPPPTGPIG